MSRINRLSAFYSNETGERFHRAGRAGISKPKIPESELSKIKYIL
jgi:hypothetical protein